MFKYILLFILSGLILYNSSCSNKAQDNSHLKSQIDKYLDAAVQVHNIPGLALVVLEDGKLLYKKYLGKTSLEEDSEVNSKTLFRVFSATKLITTTAVFQLIENGKLELEDEISLYIRDLPSNWQSVQIKNLLSHSSGLPDLVRFDNTLSDDDLKKALFNEEMDFVRGSQFRYNQTNYWFLSQIIENVTGQNFEDFILENQFADASEGVVFSSNSSDNINNRATRYFFDLEKQTFEMDTNNNGRRGHSGNGLNITLDEFVEWNNQLDANTFLREETKERMWEAFPYENKKDDFLHGWARYPLNGDESVGFTGGNLAAFRKFVSQNRTIIFLSNAYELPAYDILINDVARIVENGNNSNPIPLEGNVLKLLLKYDFEKAEDFYERLQLESPKSEFDNLRWNINSLGNNLIYQKNMPRAIDVFKFNTKVNSNWWVAFASLAECYEANEDVTKAVENYEKALKLNVSNEWNYNELMNSKIEELRG